MSCYNLLWKNIKYFIIFGTYIFIIYYVIKKEKEISKLKKTKKMHDRSASLWPRLLPHAPLPNWPHLAAFSLVSFFSLWRAGPTSVSSLSHCSDRTRSVTGNARRQPCKLPRALDAPPRARPIRPPVLGHPWPRPRRNPPDLSPFPHSSPLMPWEETVVINPSNGAAGAYPSPLGVSPSSLLSL
jgi:hypothetical protein